MDEKLLEALNNVSVSLEILANTLESSKPKSDVGQALVQGNFADQIKAVDKGIKEIKKDTTEILSNQKTIIELAKANNEHRSPFEITDKRQVSNIKTGVSTILLIAGGVLAIGAAFKLIGEVDFPSVIALSIAIPLIARSFMSVTELSNIRVSDIGKMILVMSSMSIGIVGASHILSNVKTLSNTTLLTTVAIASTFALLTPGIVKMSDGLHKTNILDALKLPIIFTAISGSIALSSYVLSTVKPIGLTQMLTAIGIGAMFTVLSYGLSKITDHTKGITPQSIITVPLLMVTMSSAIALSSAILNTTTPLDGGLSKYLTIAGLAGVMVILGYALKPISKSIEFIDLTKAVAIPILMTLMSAAVAGSSYILSETKPIDSGLLLNILLQSATIAAMATVMSVPIYLLSKMSIKDIALGSLSIVVLSTAMMASSLILSAGNYDKYPTLGWSAGVGLSLLSFGVSAVALGIIATTGVGALALIAGMAGILAVSGTIVGVDAILSNGKFTGGPSLGWSAGVGLALGAFSLTVLALGTAIVGTLGIGYLAMEAGNNAVLSISTTLVSVADILRNGNFSGGPTKEWSAGVGSAISAFAPVYLALMANNLMSIFGLGTSPEQYASAIEIISGGIVKSGEIFATSPNIWKNGPTKEWADGVGTAIASFAPVFKVLDKSIIDNIFGGGVSPEDMKSAINAIADGIITAGNKFSNANGVWNSPPSAEWATNVSKVITSFTDVYKLGSGTFGTIDPSDIERYNETIAGTGVYNDNDMSIIGTIIRAGIKFGKYAFKSIDPNFVSSLSKNITDYVSLTKQLGSGDINNKVAGIDKISGSLYLSSLAFDKMSTSVDKLTSSINRLDATKLNALKNFTGMTVLLSSVDNTKFEELMKTFEKRSDILKGVFDRESFRNSESTPTAKIPSIINVGGGATQSKSIDDLYGVMTKVLSVISSIDKSNKNISDIAEEQRTTHKTIKK